MKIAPIAGVVVGCASLLGTTIGVHGKVQDSAKRLHEGTSAAEAPKAVIANDAEEPYCTPAFKQVLSKVIHACGLAAQDARRGCQPADVKTLASISDADFNALFTPLKDRGSVVMFNDASFDLDDAAKKVIEDKWNDRKGARYFFIVARASKTGGKDYNRELSQKRANSARFHIEDFSKDQELDKKVGLLWLGNEFAQLGKDYCQWNVSRPKQCTEEAINRSAFVSWVDCQL